MHKATDVLYTRRKQPGDWNSVITEDPAVDSVSATGNITWQASVVMVDMITICALEGLLLPSVTGTLRSSPASSYTIPTAGIGTPVCTPSANFVTVASAAERQSSAIEEMTVPRNENGISRYTNNINCRSDLKCYDIGPT